MGRRSRSAGVRANGGADRIEFVFVYQGKRYRPSVWRPPTEANLRRAPIQLTDIRQRTRYGSFNFLDEFPEYCYAAELDPTAATTSQHAPTAVAPSPNPGPPEPPAERTCNEVSDTFLPYCEMRARGNDLAFSTVNYYRMILN